MVATRVLANARRAAGLAHNNTEESPERLLAEQWPRRLPFAQFMAAFVTYLRRFAQSVPTLAALNGEWIWKQSGPVQSRLELLNRRLSWLEEQTGRELLQTPWPEAEAQDTAVGDTGFGGAGVAAELPTALRVAGKGRSRENVARELLPCEHLIYRLERQVEVLHRVVRILRENGWISGAGYHCPFRPEVTAWKGLNRRLPDRISTPAFIKTPPPRQICDK